jgi:predicted N-acetyltransferase YhbS
VRPGANWYRAGVKTRTAHCTGNRAHILSTSLTARALMDALLTAADVAHVPLIVLLGSPQYYSRFGFRPAEQLGVTPPEAGWGDAFQARPLTAYTSLVAGPFQYAPAFSP